MQSACAVESTFVESNAAGHLVLPVSEPREDKLPVTAARQRQV